MPFPKRIRKPPRRDRQFLVLLSPGEKRKLSRLAAISGVTMSEAVRRLINEADQKLQLAS